LPATHFASINHVTALRILNVILRAKDCYSTHCYTLFTLAYKYLRPWEVLSLNDPWSFAAFHSPMYYINRSTWTPS